MWTTAPDATVHCSLTLNLVSAYGTTGSAEPARRELDATWLSPQLAPATTQPARQ
jgi:hypothetical protein